MSDDTLWFIGENYASNLYYSFEAKFSPTNQSAIGLEKVGSISYLFPLLRNFHLQKTTPDKKGAIFESAAHHYLLHYFSLILFYFIILFILFILLKN